MGSVAKWSRLAHDLYQTLNRALRVLRDTNLSTALVNIQMNRYVNLKSRESAQSKAWADGVRKQQGKPNLKKKSKRAKLRPSVSDWTSWVHKALDSFRQTVGGDSEMEQKARRMVLQKFTDEYISQKTGSRFHIDVGGLDRGRNTVLCLPYTQDEFMRTRDHEFANMTPLQFKRYVEWFNSKFTHTYTLYFEMDKHHTVDWVVTQIARAYESREVPYIGMVVGSHNHMVAAIIDVRRGTWQFFDPNGNSWSFPPYGLRDISHALNRLAVNLGLDVVDSSSIRPRMDQRLGNDTTCDYLYGRCVRLSFLFLWWVYTHNSNMESFIKAYMEDRVNDADVPRLLLQAELNFLSLTRARQGRRRASH